MGTSIYVDEIRTEIPSLKNKPLISFDELMKVDIRICKILTCERVKDTDKLYKLTIDTGSDETRTVVSAIADKISENSLIGYKYPFVMNLEPRVIKGIESQAMIVIADNNGKYEFINEDSTLGSVIF